MNLAEWCKLKRDNANLSDEEFAVLAWNKQRENIRIAIMEQEQKKIDKEIDKKIESVIENSMNSIVGNLNLRINPIKI